MTCSLPADSAAPAFLSWVSTSLFGSPCGAWAGTSSVYKPHLSNTQECHKLP